MLETQEQETLPFTNDDPRHEEVNEYEKQIDDGDNFAEKVEEIENESGKKIRAKNSRMFAIAVVGIGLLGLVYFQANRQATAVSPIESAMKKPDTADERLAEQVPVVEDESSAASIPVPPSKVAEVSPSPKPESSARKILPATKKEKAGFFIQTGAFRVKQNAESFSQQLQAKGFAPSIQAQSQKIKQRGARRVATKSFSSDSRGADASATIYIVQLGVFPSREKARIVQEKLARSGYPETFLR